MELKPLTGQEAINELIDHFLGENWYVVDPLGVTQVNAIAVDDIKRLFPQNKRKRWNHRASKVNAEGREGVLGREGEKKGGTHMSENMFTVPDKWISTKERLPEKLGTYLCYVLIPTNGGGATKEYRCLKYVMHDKTWACMDMIVTHWMPLPEPPKED